MSTSVRVMIADTRKDGFDLLRIGAIRALVLWRGFPYVFQGAMLGVLLGLAALGWGQVPPAGVPDKLFAKSNLVTLLVWGLWWPGMVIATVLLGRAWCAICPLELVANVSERVGRTLGFRQRALPRRAASGFVALALFAAMQMLIPGGHLHRVPALTALVLSGLLLLAVATGLLYEHRAFCRGFCPASLLLGSYGRGGVLAIRPGPAETCRACAGKECVRADRRDRWTARSCPSLLNPARLQHNGDCLMCAECVKACSSDNMRLLLRRPFSGADARTARVPRVMTLFVMLVSGFVISELCSEWEAAKALFGWVPGYLTAALGAKTLGGWIEGIWTIVIVPVVLWTVLGGVVVLLGGARGLGDAWRRLALPLAVVVAAGHVSKGLAKTTSWIGFIPGALSDPAGSVRAAAISAKTIPSPPALVSLPVVGAVAVVLVAASVWLGTREARLADPDRLSARAVPVLLVGALFLAILTGWLRGG
ncbi:MAG: 4Fe-4S binding protein [Armatimonadetes bacterium]|nr:4Fe-4S binding protein [Armatimonadota bacterium]